MKHLFSLPFLFMGLQIFAQSKENERAMFGFFLEAEGQSVGIQNLNYLGFPEKLSAGSDALKLGVSVGAFLRKPVFRFLTFQPELGLSYVKNTVHFFPAGSKTFRFLDVEMPIHFVVSDWKRSDFPLRGCVIFGGRLGWNIVNNPTDLLQIAQERFALDLGLGAEIKFGGWRLQPAFVYSHGLNNLHSINGAEYDGAVGRIVRDKLALRLSVWKVGK